jgi:hypothetical protein
VPAAQTKFIDLENLYPIHLPNGLDLGELSP